MAEKRYAIHATAEGSWQQDEDWWELVVNSDTGERTVEHRWHHMNPYKGKVTSEGKEALSLEEASKEFGDKFAAAMKKADRNA